MLPNRSTRRLNGYEVRFNRRTLRCRGKVFFRLFQNAIGMASGPYKRAGERRAGAITEAPQRLVGSSGILVIRCDWGMAAFSRLSTPLARRVGVDPSGMTVRAACGNRRSQPTMALPLSWCWPALPRRDRPVLVDGPRAIPVSNGLH